MFRFAAICLLVAVATQAAPLPFAEVDIEKIPEGIRVLIPKEVVEFYKGLTPEDKQILKGLGEEAKDLKFQTEQEAIEALKAKSESLYNRAKVIYDLVKSKVDALQPEAKDFFKQTVAAARSLRPVSGQVPSVNTIKETIRGVISKYQALPESAKTDLQQKFPQITALLQHKMVQKVIKTKLN
ncbi:hypothetical protein QR680_013778 [Steinernema hermaphroditum]|uniref:Fatty-acid and retinol-binding protein 1 n=1 Tax=Steinernema hermaphroditum TaxID=289476 RepID=A0AA39I8Y3_9BILA|nr:hypothetical protein QR680_013778 [Steinernema hermaphroditum]